MSFAPPSPPPERLSGSIERVTFHNPDTGFCVLRLKVAGRRDLETVVGHVASVAAGEEIRAVEKGEIAAEESPLRHAPHTVS